MKKEEIKEIQERVLSLLEKVSKQWGIGKPAGKVWAYLLFEGKPITQREIEERIGYSRGLISRSLKRLIELELVMYNKKGNTIYYVANTSLIDGYNKLMISFLKEDIKPLIEYLNSIKGKVRDEEMKKRIEKAIEEYMKLEIIMELFSKKIKKLSYLNVNTLKDIERMTREDNNER